MGIITNMYKWFANSIIRYLLTPDGPPIYFTNSVWRPEVFTHLFVMMMVVSSIIAAAYYFWLNGRNAPAVFGKRGHWFNALLVALITNFVVAVVYILIVGLPGGNHLYCIGITNAIYGIIAFFILSAIMQFKSPSAKGVPFVSNS